MNKSLQNKKYAFSLVEAMIILVLISVAVMALIPLMNAKKTDSPKWSPIRDNDKNIVGTYYGLKNMDRVGLANVDPYNVNINAKLALSKLFLKSSSDINGIVWSDNFVNSGYEKHKNPNGAITIGMNTCLDDTDANRTTIRSTAEVANKSNIPTCTSYDTNINLGNRIIAKTTSSAVAIGTTDIQSLVEKDALKNNSKIYVGRMSAGGSPIERDLFVFRYPNNNLAMEYSYVSGVGKLKVAPKMTVAGDVYFKTYGISTSESSATNVKCDIDEGYGTCTRYDGDPRAPYFHDVSSGITFFETATHWGAFSDLRLKDVLAPYKKGIKDISKVETYLYTFKNDKKQQNRVGIIAQKLIGVFDEALHKDSNGYYSYERDVLMYAMTNSAKEIYDKQDELSKKQKEANSEADKLIRMYK
ncbi:MAG: tail fiber domain-containing protein [bacterium]|nr:tail fiber domain-containing protein [bacterium]